EKSSSKRAGNRIAQAAPPAKIGQTAADGQQGQARGLRNHSLRREHGHPVISGVGNEDLVTGVHGHAFRRIELCSAEGGEKAAAVGELLETVAVKIGHEDIATAVHGNTIRIHELAVAAAGAAERREEIAGVVKLLHSVIEEVGHEYIASAIRGYAE